MAIPDGCEQESRLRALLTQIASEFSDCEVGLVFANVGLTAGVLSRELFSALLVMVIGTTLVTPPLLTWALGRWGATMGRE